MRWKTPRWWQHRGMIARLLWPAGKLFALGARWRQWRGKPVRVAVPVICIGNAVAGGAGKTPITLSIAEFLKAQGFAVHILSRGYGAQRVSALAVRVHPTKHTAADVGDEPLLLAQTAPCWIGANRTHTARAAIAAGAQVLLMDDGWQYPHLHKDVNILVVDGAYGVGNGWCLPAGPLREPWADALARADAMVVMGHTPDATRHPLAPANLSLADASIFTTHARTQPIEADAQKLKDTRVLAFAGIAHPTKFFTTLERLGAHVADTRSFADHHPYTEKELEALALEARSQKAELVTTTKDWVRLPLSWKHRIQPLHITCVWDDADAWQAWLLEQLKR